MKKKLFDNWTDYAVAAFILSVALMLGFCERADADISIDYWHDSTAGISSENPGLDRLCGRYTFENDKTSMVFCPLIAVGGDTKSDSFEIGIAERFGRFEVQLQLNRYDGVMDGGISARRMIGDGPFQLGIGGTYWANQSPGSNSYFTFNLGMRYQF